MKGERLLYVVRVDGFTHYVRKDVAGQRNFTLCEKPPQSTNGQWTFRKKLTDGRICNRCLSLASSELSRIVFG